ncbi:MAG TPA: hypothetical protein VGG39_17660 [Polyangiaceae bacterium]|jgi:hypothetical protein
MNARLAVVLLSAASSLGLCFGLVAGCSSSSSGTGTGSEHEAGGGSDTGAASETGSSGDAGGGADSALDGGNGLHDGPAPDALYGCAAQGSFGWSCTATEAGVTGPDPTDCTDPAFPDCFVGGQGSWCTKTCTGDPDCTGSAEDAGCAPASCNTRGYCK